MADLPEPWREDVHKEAADELHCAKPHHLGLPAIPVVSPIEGHNPFGQAQDAVVRDCHPVCVAGEVLDDFPCILERRPAIHHPVFVV